MDQTQPLTMRCRFTKTGPIRYISHLDLTRAFHRAIFRAGIPIKYSEGFSPHPKFTLALPLSVGMESLCEAADFSLREGAILTPAEVKARLAEQMPAGIGILSVAEATEKLNRIAFARYEVFLPQTPPPLANEVDKALKGPLAVEKKNKKGKPVVKEISPGIRRAEVSLKNGGLRLVLTLAAGGDMILGPDTVLQALAGAVEGLNKTGRTATRLCLLREDESIF